MKKQVQNKHWVNLLIYNLLVSLLAVASFAMVILAIINVITLKRGPYRLIFFLIWGFFLIDYLIRLKLAPSKKDFLISNLFDLIALIPSHPIFALFRIARIITIIRDYNLLWKLGWTGKFTNEIHRFLYDTGFIYLFSISLVILIGSSLVFASFEHVSLQEALWWAITTATTVGYGDETPHTAGGKIVASLLMLGGIGFLGLLTSTITGFFTKQDVEEDRDRALKHLTKQVDHLSKQVSQLQKTIQTPQERKPKPAPKKKHHQ
ncbi:ion channel [Lentilactobacillus raoultii]|uniref:Ion channel n=1 Tax=Lentilactobacillus raoultii TaxID=1987503 RepID=A0ABW3PV56_9LACO|nr:potassium channel family protein [Lentilactobacillus raoultii]